MWGYRGDRAGRHWEWAGKWAAWMDDVLSWVPARMTALLLVMASGRWWLKGLRAEAQATPSPNGGWPMATMALLLGVRLGKAGVYVLNSKGCAPVSMDVVRGCRLAVRALVLSVLVCWLLLWGVYG
jgi:adenosylcobinamide-phosphate synthase